VKKGISSVIIAVHREPTGGVSRYTS